MSQTDHTSQIPAIDFSPYVPLALIVDGVLDPDVVRRMRGWLRARWLIAEDAARLDAATRIELLTALRGGMVWDQRFLLVTADPTALAPAFVEDPPPNVAVLAQVTTQAEAAGLLAGFCGCRAALRGVLVRPPAEPIDLSPWLSGADRLDWVIAAGVDAPLHPRRVEDLRGQCAAGGVPFWFDGWGEWVPISEIWPGEDRGAEQASAWYRAPGDPDDLPTLTYRLGARFRPTLHDRYHRQVPAGWGVPRSTEHIPFVVDGVYQQETIAAYIRQSRGVDPSLLDMERWDGPTIILQNSMGGRLAVFEATGCEASWRCVAIGDPPPSWATKVPS